MNQNQLQGLIIPPKDAGFNTELWLGLFVLAGLLGFIAWRWYKKKLQNQALITAKKSLHALQHSYENASQSLQLSQDKALELVSLLCQGLAVKRLDQYQPDDLPKWQKFHQKLNVLCYSSCYSSHSSKPLNIELGSLFKEAKQWLSIK